VEKELEITSTPCDAVNGVDGDEGRAAEEKELEVTILGCRQWS